MNLKMVGKYLGHLIMAEAVFLLPSALVAAFYHERQALFALSATIAIGAVLAGILYWVCRGQNTTFYAREGFVVAGAGWVLLSLLGALPFVFSGTIPHFLYAFFESASGFTTTGASVLSSVEDVSRGILFWRSSTHWLGGIGVLAFVLAIVRGKSGAGSSLHLLRAETPGPQKGKIRPKTHKSVRTSFLVYVALSVANLIFLLAGGMPVFDAFCTMFGTAGTGGFGIMNNSMAAYSTYLQTVTAIFLVLFGINFTLYVMLIAKEWKDAIKDEELHLYIGIILVAIVGITASLVFSGYAPLGQSLHESAFTVSSIITTAGFSIANFDVWPQFARMILLLLMFCGAMAGSTGGGFKVSRFLILLKGIRSGLYQLLHPRSVRVVRINGRKLEEDVTNRTSLFLAVYCLIILFVTLLISLDGNSFETNFTAVVTCFNNVGPGFGSVGPQGNFSVYSPASAFLLSLTMLLGRLEIFPILLLFSPDTWRRKT